LKVPGVWRAKNPLLTPFYHLVAEQKPAVLARFPNDGAGWLFNWTAKKVDGKSGFEWSNLTGLPEKFETRFARAYVWHPYGYSEVTGLSNVSFVNRTAALDPSPHFMLVKMFLDGALEFLDEPGEWALGQDNYVYYWPSPLSPDPNKLIVTACGTESIFDVRGKSSNPTDIVTDIAISNLTIAGTSAPRNFASEWENRMNSQPGVDPTGECGRVVRCTSNHSSFPDLHHSYRAGNWANTREGSLRVENASRISLVGCKLIASGSSGVWLEHFAQVQQLDQRTHMPRSLTQTLQHITIENNWIEHVHAWGVHINGWDLGGGKKIIPGSYEFSNPASADVNFGHVVRNK
jgi:hypothetical protein